MPGNDGTDADVRFISDGERTAFTRRFVETFGDDPLEGDVAARRSALVDTHTMIGAFAGSEIVATFASYDLDLSIPGGSVPVAGTTAVSVAPHFRRRGLLTQMMRLHLEQARRRDQPIAALWASEFGIYQRFGYGMAGEMHEVSFDSRRTVVPAPSDGGVRIRRIDPADSRSDLSAIHDVSFGSRPGTVRRTEEWWDARVLPDLEKFRGGKSTHRWVLVEEDGRPTAYAAYRQKQDWNSTGSDGVLSVSELVATTDVSTRALWSYLSHFDLFPNVDYWNVPADDPLPWLVTDPRHIKRDVGDGLWVRILDVASAISARSYRNDGSVVIELGDRQFEDQNGRFQITVQDGRGRAERTDALPDVRMDVSTLGSLYLGADWARILRAADRIHGPYDAVDAVRSIFSWPVAPWTMEVF